MRVGDGSCFLLQWSREFCPDSLGRAWGEEAGSGPIICFPAYIRRSSSRGLCSGITAYGEGFASKHSSKAALAPGDLIACLAFYSVLAQVLCIKIESRKERKKRSGGSQSTFEYS